MDKNYISNTEQTMNTLLENGIITAEHFLNKNYLINLNQRKVVPYEKSARDENSYRIFQVEKLVYDKKENVNDKLISVYSALLDIDSSALLIISGTKETVEFYLGVKSLENVVLSGKILENGFKGNFPGSELRPLKNPEIYGLLEYNACNKKNISSVTVIPAARDEDKDKFVQGIEKLIDTMHGQNYMAILIAKPVTKTDLEERRRGYENLYSSLSSFMKTTLTYGENYSNAVTNGMSKNFTQSVSENISETQGRNISNSVNATEGSSNSSGWVGMGANGSQGFSKSTSVGQTSGISWSKSVSEGKSESTSSGTSSSNTDTSGNSRTFNVEHQNKTISDLLQKIDDQIKRIKVSEAFGVWDCAAYFIADSAQTAIVAANSYKALMLGDGTNVENSYINIWNPLFEDEKNSEEVWKYLKHGCHPVFEVPEGNGQGKQYASPANMVSGKELPLLMGLPRKSVPGLTVTSMAEFGRNVYIQNSAGAVGRKQIKLGIVRHMGSNDPESPVKLDLNSFTSHCFITGSTGSGKSNTSYCLLEEFIRNNIPFLIIEPAKGEYKEEFGALEDINIYTTNPYIAQMLKLNPFRFDPHIHVLEHLDRLIEIFNACWEMYAAMPAILKDAIERIYVDKGWDLQNSVYLRDGDPEYPTFNDLMVTLPTIINSSSYSADTKGDYTGALVTRVSSLTKGISGQIFCDNYDISDEILFDRNTIVDLSRVGSTETKSLIMGILVLKLTEHRMANADQANSDLRHVTVLEEAHNLLKKTTPGQQGSNVIGKSVEMICNSIAEMRTYGEGFIIIDQSPTAVDIAAIKNTNTKIIMRLPEKNDCEAVGNAAGLNEDQIKELSRLSTGSAVVMQNNWLEAVLTQVNASSREYTRPIKAVSYDEVQELRGLVVKNLLKQEKRKIELSKKNETSKVDLREVIEVINSARVSEFKKSELRYCMQNIVPRLNRLLETDLSRRNLLFSKTMLNLSGAGEIFRSSEKKIKPARDGKGYSPESAKEWYKEVNRELRKAAPIAELNDHEMRLYIHILITAMHTRIDRIDYKALFKEVIQIL